ncbi:hypothetical protein GQ600_12314 [Phytophthora cactorum]|nr:hypothetical protein GQ600_12314 [Phytophthora cactorum]
MTTKATYEATSAGMAASDSAASASKAAVVDVTDGDDPWTTTSARSTMDPPPLCTSKCAASRVATGAALVEAREGKKKVTKHAYESIAVRTGRKKPEEGEGGASDSSTYCSPSAPEVAIMAELRAMRKKPVTVRTVPTRDSWDGAGPGIVAAQNAKGEIPPPDVRLLTRASSPKSSKKTKGDYNPL